MFYLLLDYIKVLYFIMIFGNIIDNVFDVVSEREEKSVFFFVMDIGCDIVFEVIDSGIGILVEKIIIIF